VRRQRSSRASDTSSCISNSSASKPPHSTQRAAAVDSNDTATAAATAAAASTVDTAATAIAAPVPAEAAQEQHSLPGRSGVSPAELSRLHAQSLAIIRGAAVRGHWVVEPVDVPSFVVKHVVGKGGATLKRLHDDFTVDIRRPNSYAHGEVERMYVEGVTQEQVDRAVNAILDIVEERTFNEQWHAARNLPLDVNAPLQLQQQQVDTAAVVPSDTTTVSGAAAAVGGSVTTASSATAVHSSCTDRAAASGNSMAGRAHRSSDSSSSARVQQQQSEAVAVPRNSYSSSSNSGNAVNTAVSRPAASTAVTSAADDSVTARVTLPRDYRQVVLGSNGAIATRMQDQYHVT
jgi:KH domain